MEPLLKTPKRKPSKKPAKAHTRTKPKAHSKAQPVPAPAQTVLVLRTCKSDLTAYNNFQWPDAGPVKCPDWRPVQECGHGLHGLRWGAGDSSLVSWDLDAKWLVVAVPAETIVDLGPGKCKFPAGTVVHCGDRASATQYLYANGRPGYPIVGLVLAVGDRATVTGGAHSTVTGGAHSTVTGGDDSNVTGGAWSKVTGGERSTVTGGERSTVTGGAYSTVTGGHNSTVTGGNDSTVTGGAWSTVTGGEGSKAKAGPNSRICIAYWNHTTDRSRTCTGYVGEDGIQPDVFYRVDNGKLVPA